MSDLKIQTEWLPQLSKEEFDQEAAAHMTGSRGVVGAMVVIGKDAVEYQ